MRSNRPPVLALVGKFIPDKVERPLMAGHEDWSPSTLTKGSDVDDVQVFTRDF